MLYCPSILNNVAKDAKHHEITNMSCILLTFFITKTVEKLKKPQNPKKKKRGKNNKRKALFHISALPDKTFVTVGDKI